MWPRLALLAALVQTVGTAGAPIPASVSGRVIDALSNAPIEGAKVMAVHIAEVSSDRITMITESAVTDAQGQFTIPRLPAGSIRISANADGFEMGLAGARASDQPGAEFTVPAGTHLTGVTIRLRPLGAICGVVLDSTGTPAARRPVDAYTMIPNAGLVRFYASAGTVTDANGAYCIEKLHAASYILIAAAQPASTSQPARAAAFYPSMTSSAQATVIDLEAGARLSGFNITYSDLPTHTVSGRTTRYDQGLAAVLMPVDRHMLAPSVERFAADVNPDGTFRVDHVPSGAYDLEVVTARRGVAETLLYGEMPVAVDSDDVSNLEVAVTNGARVSGIVKFTTAERTPRSAVTLNISSADGRSFPSESVAKVGPDGRFTSPQLAPGDYLLLPRLLDGSFPESMTWRGVDISGTPLHIGAEDIDGVVVTMTDTPATISGVVHDDKGAAADADIVLFPKDASKWASANFGAVRLVRSRTALDGAFNMNAMPGEYWLAAAPHQRNADLWDRQTLARLMVNAQSVHVTSSAALRVDLRLR